MFYFQNRYAILIMPRNRISYLRKGMSLVKSIFSLYLYPYVRWQDCVAAMREWTFSVRLSMQGRTFYALLYFVSGGKRRMKKKTSILIIGMIISSVILSGCQNNALTLNNSSEMETTSEKEQNSENDTPVENEEQAPSMDIPEFDTTSTIEQTVLWDADGISVTATDLSYSGNSCELYLTIANNSGKDLSFTSGTMGYSRNAVNGYMIDDGYLSADIANGVSSEEVMSFNTEQLIIYGITQVADISIGINAEDADGNTIQLYPMQVKTSAYDTYDYEADTFKDILNSGLLEAIYNCSIDYSSDEELYNQGNVRITSHALITNTDGQKSFLFEIENNTENCVFGTTSGISVNGMTIYSYNWSIDAINSGTRRIAFISLNDLADINYMDIFGITDISGIGFTFGVTDTNNAEINSPADITVPILDSSYDIDSSGEEVYNNNGIRIISKGIQHQEDEYTNYDYPVFLVENNSSEKITVGDAYTSFLINGTEMDYAILRETELQAGTVGLIYYSLDSDSLSELGITDINTITASLYIKNADSYDLIDEPQITINY